ncbi:hypothetical protein KL86PLE_90319 [uncultured Pleomorphomonas sp.]|uniref:Uncharacterized protein n=1 Tax=uncultured Pleomorphomonas sp. TaxID=442121 RepID=A0A212LNZ7_9HYPH|nr:hypothetical protein KL86PLE_90319 [uncultured Pleomorphomonas sp.]
MFFFLNQRKKVNSRQIYRYGDKKYSTFF